MSCRFRLFTVTCHFYPPWTSLPIIHQVLQTWLPWTLGHNTHWHVYSHLITEYAHLLPKTLTACIYTDFPSFVKWILSLLYPSYKQSFHQQTIFFLYLWLLQSSDSAIEVSFQKHYINFTLQRNSKGFLNPMYVAWLPYKYLCNYYNRNYTILQPVH